MKTALLALALSAPTFAAPDELWIEDYDQAVKVAKEQGKDLLVDFTGSDWCGWCIRLHDEVFKHEEFFEPVSKGFVLVSLDFPRGEEARAKVPNPERNAQLAERHAITGYPTVLLMTPAGEVYGRTGYQPGGAAAYVEHLNELTKKGRASLAEVQRLVAAAAEGEGDARLAALERVRERLVAEPQDSPFRGQLAGALHDALEAVPADRAPEILRAILKDVRVGPELVEKARSLDPKNAAGLWADTLLAHLDSIADEQALPAAMARIDALMGAGVGVATEPKEQLCMLGAYWNKEFLKKPEEAKRYAKLGLEVTQDARFQRFFEGILEGE